jgi:hypothetical protein
MFGIIRGRASDKSAFSLGFDKKVERGKGVLLG